MVLDIKEKLKSYDLLVNLSRFSKHLPAIWQQIRDERKQEVAKRDVVNLRRQIIDDYLSNHQIHKLQIGAGENQLASWLNTDLEPVTTDILFFDALEEFPFDDNEFDYVFSEHMIEHIPYKGGLSMLKECYRVIKTNGKIRIATPDVENIVGLFSPTRSSIQRQYIEWSARNSLGLYSMEKTQLQLRREEWDIGYDHILRQYPEISHDSVCFIVNNFFRSYGHQFLYNEITLAGILREANFTNIQRYAPSESDDPELKNLNRMVT